MSAQDAYGNTATGYRGTVQFSSSDGAAALPASYTFQANDGGVHSFSGVTLKTAGSQTVTATDTSTTSITGGQTVAVSAGSATQLTIETAANGTGTAIGVQGVTAGSSFTAYAITRDAYGNYVANPSATWSLSNTSSGVAASDLSSTSGASTVCTGHLVGSATLHAVVGSLTANTGTVTVNPGSATQLTLSGLTSQTAGSAQSLTVSAQDAYGNTATGYRGTVQFSSSDGAAALPASYTFQANDGGVHSFSGVTLKTAGSQTVTATDTSTTSITGGQTVTVSAGSATQLTIETAANGTGTAIGVQGVTAGSSFTAYAITRDAYGNYVANPSATWSLSNGMNPADLSTGSGASSTFTGAKVGTTVVHAVVGSLTANTGTVTVNPGSATQLTLSGLTSQTAGSAQSLTVSAQDAYGNTATGYRGTVQFSSSDPAASLPANYTFVAGDQGVSPQLFVTLWTGGMQWVGGTDTVHPTICGSENVQVSNDDNQ